MVLPVRIRLFFVIVFAVLLAWALGCGPRQFVGELPGPTPTPAVAPTATPFATPTPTAVPGTTPTPGATPTPTPGGTPGPTPTPGATPTATPGTPGVTPTPGAGQPPRVTLRALPTQGNAPLDVTFDGTATDDGQIVEYTLDYGDRSPPYTSTEPPQNVLHRYLLSGTYEATLRATDNEGLEGSASVTITVTQPPPDTGDVDLIIE